MKQTTIITLSIILFSVSVGSVIAQQTSVFESKNEQSSEPKNFSQIGETSIIVAIFGFFGVATGAVISVGGMWVVEWWKNRPRKRLDESRKRMLLTMLQDRRYEELWRKLSTLSHVIGTDDDEAKRLLIELGARASSDGQQLWGLLKYHPLDSHKTHYQKIRFASCPSGDVKVDSYGYREVDEVGVVLCVFDEAGKVIPATAKYRAEHVDEEVTPPWL